MSRLLVLLVAAGVVLAWVAGETGTAYGLSLAALGLALMWRAAWA